MVIVNLDEQQLERLSADLMAIYDAAYQGDPQHFYRTSYPTHQYLHWLYEGDPRGFHVALEDETPVGFISLHSDWHERSGRYVAEIQEVAVRPEWVGMGIGSALIREVEEFARRQGRDIIALWVGENNTPAAALYRKLGFQQTRQAGVWHRMEKSLTNEL